MIAYPQHHEVRLVPKREETIEGWRAFAVTALNSEGHVIRWSLYERAPDPRRYTGKLNHGPVHRAA